MHYEQQKTLTVALPSEAWNLHGYGSVLSKAKPYLQKIIDKNRRFQVQPRRTRQMVEIY